MRKRDVVPSDPFAAAAEARLDAHTTALKRDIYSAVRPIYVADTHGHPDQVGSCVLLEVGGRRFLATAAHVCDYFTKGAVYVGGNGTFVEIRGTVMRTNPPSATANDWFDVAFVEIAGEFETGLESCTYFSPDRLDIDDPASGTSIYAAVGYAARRPLIDFIARKHSAAMIAFTSYVDEEAFKVLPLQRGVHLPLTFIPKKMRSGGRTQSPPHPEGVSGGAVLRFDNLAHAEFVPGHDKLVAIITEYRRSPRSVLIATNVALHLEAIAAEFPDLRRYIPVPSQVRLRPVRTERRGP